MFREWPGHGGGPRVDAVLDPAGKARADWPRGAVVDGEHDERDAWLHFSPHRSSGTEVALCWAYHAPAEGENSAEFVVAAPASRTSAPR